MQFSKCIVLIEDDVEIREMFAALMRSEGYVVRTFGSCEEALAYTERTEQPVVVIFGGLRFVTSNYVRVERLSWSAFVRIILATGAPRHLLPLLRRIVVLAKPFDVDTFLSAVAAAMSRACAPEGVRALYMSPTAALSSKTFA